MIRHIIRWQDFVLDQNIGPYLDFVEETGEQCRVAAEEEPGVMEDARVIQETGQEQRLARMAGLTSLDSNDSDKEVCRQSPVATEQEGGRG